MDAHTAAILGVWAATSCAFISDNVPGSGVFIMLVIAIIVTVV